MADATFDAIKIGIASPDMIRQRNNQKHEEIIKKNDPNSVFHKKLL